jgi:hypothetical protein
LNSAGDTVRITIQRIINNKIFLPTLIGNYIFHVGGQIRSMMEDRGEEITPLHRDQYSKYGQYNLHHAPLAINQFQKYRLVTVAYIKIRSKASSYGLCSQRFPKKKIDSTIAQAAQVSFLLIN